MRFFLQMRVPLYTVAFSFYFFCSYCFALNSDKYPWYFEPNQVEKCWKITKGKGVVVDVLDAEIQYVSILKGQGYSSLNPDYSSTPPSGSQVDLHGTAIASLIVGNLDKLICNESSKYLCDKDGKIVVAGIAPEAKVIGRTWYPGGNLEMALLDTFNENIPATKFGQPCRKVVRQTKLILANLSGGYRSSFSGSSDIKDTIKRNAKGSKYFLIIAGVGNDGVELNGKNVNKYGLLPAIFHFKGIRDPIIRVGATSRYDSQKPAEIFEYTNSRYTSGSNYGKGFVDVLAPGMEIPVLTPSSEAMISNGTSEATAIVSGAAALISSCNPFADADNIRQALLVNSDAHQHLVSKVKNGQVLNIYKTVKNYCQTQPSGGNQNITSGNGQCDYGFKGNNQNDARCTAIP